MANGFRNAFSAVTTGLSRLGLVTGPGISVGGAVLNYFTADRSTPLKSQETYKDSESMAAAGIPLVREIYAARHGASKKELALEVLGDLGMAGFALGPAVGFVTEGITRLVEEGTRTVNDGAQLFGYGIKDIQPGLISTVATAIKEGIQEGMADEAAREIGPAMKVSIQPDTSSQKSASDSPTPPIQTAAGPKIDGANSARHLLLRSEQSKSPPDQSNTTENVYSAGGTRKAQDQPVTASNLARFLMNI
jgi:hypothetical protein